MRIVENKKYNIDIRFVREKNKHRVNLNIMLPALMSNMQFISIGQNLGVYQNHLNEDRITRNKWIMMVQ
jgi:hypothetical protein